MKKQQLILTVLILLSVSCFSQEHLKFKDIPIDGNINLFSKLLVNQGFTMSSSKENIIILNGEFITKKNCDIYIFGSKKSNIVWQVGVFFPVDISWSSIKRDYFEIKAQYQLKYGNPEISNEAFLKPYYDGDGYEFQALKVEKCNYSSFWETETSLIMVSIGSNRKISILYEDKQNYAIQEKEKKEVISKDI